MNIDRVLTFTLVIAAVAVAGTRIYGMISPGADGPRIISSPDAPPTYVRSWESAIPIANRAGGNPDGPVKIVVFSDYECPGCSQFHSTTKELLSERFEEIELLHIHFPLALHRFALPAARGAECAHAEGKFAEWVDIVYENQDSLGLKTWSSLAEAAGIDNVVDIQECAESGAEVGKIEAGVAYGKEIGVLGTPTVLVNGWKYNGQLTKERLYAAIDSLLRDANPK
jgi:protein-disulfide isomerase